MEVLSLSQHVLPEGDPKANPELACEHLRIPKEELEDMARERDI